MNDEELHNDECSRLQLSIEMQRKSYGMNK